MSLSMQADANQVAAHWTRLAYESISRFTREEQAKRGFTQPQFWILRHLSPQDLLRDAGGLTVQELKRAMVSYLRPEDDPAREADALLGRGWIERDDDDRLRLTNAGESARLEMMRAAPDIRSLIHQGVDDADYVAALTVLQKLIANTTPPSATPEGLRAQRQPSSGAT